MCVYYCANSGMVEQLCGYEGVRTLESMVQVRIFGDFVWIAIMEVILLEVILLEYFWGRSYWGNSAQG